MLEAALVDERWLESRSIHLIHLSEVVIGSSMHWLCSCRTGDLRGQPHWPVLHRTKLPANPSDDHVYHSIANAVVCASELQHPTDNTQAARIRLHAYSCFTLHALRIYLSPALRC